MGTLLLGDPAVWWGAGTRGQGASSEGAVLQALVREASERRCHGADPRRMRRRF